MKRPDASDPLTTFPVKGGGVWTLTVGQFRELRSVYGDTGKPSWVRAELLKAKLWLEANPERRKVKMMVFLVRWLNREHARRGGVAMARVKNGAPASVQQILEGLRRGN